MRTLLSRCCSLSVKNNFCSPFGGKPVGGLFPPAFGTGPATKHYQVRIMGEVFFVPVAIDSFSKYSKDKSDLFFYFLKIISVFNGS